MSKLTCSILSVSVEWMVTVFSSGGACFLFTSVLWIHVDHVVVTGFQRCSSC